MSWDGERMLGILGGILGIYQGLGSPGKRDTGDWAPLGWGEDIVDTGGVTGGIPGSGIPWEEEPWGLGSPGMGRGCWGYWRGYWGDARVWDPLGWGGQAAHPRPASLGMSASTQPSSGRLTKGLLVTVGRERRLGGRLTAAPASPRRQSPRLPTAARRRTGLTWRRSGNSPRTSRSAACRWG